MEEKQKISDAFTKHFREQAQQEKNAIMKATIEGVKKTRKQIQRISELLSDRNRVFQNYKEYNEQLLEIDKALHNLRNIEFNSTDSIDRMNQFKQKYEELRSKIDQFNLSISQYASSGVFDENFEKAISGLCLPVTGIREYQNLLTSLDYAFGNINTQILNAELQNRETLASIVGSDMALSMTLPTHRYNYQGNINDKTVFMGDLTQQLLPYVDKQKELATLVNNSIGQIEELKMQKPEYEKQAIQKFEEILKNPSKATNDKQFSIDTQNYLNALEKEEERILKILSLGEDLENEDLEGFYSSIEEFQKELKTMYNDIHVKLTAATDIQNRYNGDTKKLIFDFNNAKADIMSSITQIFDKQTELYVDTINSLYQHVSTPDAKISQLMMLNHNLDIQNEQATTQMNEGLYGYRYQNFNFSDNNAPRMLKAYRRAMSKNPSNHRLLATNLENEELRTYMQYVVHINKQNNAFIKEEKELGFNNSVETQTELLELYSPAFLQSGEAHKHLLNNIAFNPFISQADKQIQDSILESSREALENINKLLMLFDGINKNNPAYESLVKQKSELQVEIEKIEKLRNPFDSLAKALGKVYWAKSKLGNALKGGLGFLGIGAILHPLTIIRKMADLSKSHGAMSYAVSMADLSMGLNINSSNNMDLSYTAPQSYYNLTFGAIPFDTVSKTYKGFSKNVGGGYGVSKEQSRNDMAYFAKNTVADKELYGLGDGDIQTFLKTFYKDMHDNAQDALSKLRMVEGKAISSSIPMEKLLQTINSMTEGLRAMGIESNVVLNSITSMAGWHGMRIEDAKDMVQETANAGEAMSKDWSRNIFWGMMANPDSITSPFDTLLEGSLSHHADGSVNEKYYDTLVDRLFTESSFFGDRWGGVGNDLGSLDMVTHLLDQGYTLKQANTIINLKKEGKIDELKKKLKGYDKLKDPEAPANTTRDLAQQLTTSANQLSEFTKIQSRFISFMNNLAHNLEQVLSPIVKNAHDTIVSIITTYETVMSGMIASVGGFFNSPVGKTLTNSFQQSPFLTMAGLLAGGTAMKYAGKRLLKDAWNGIRHGKSGWGKSGKVALATTALVGLGAGFLNAYEGETPNGIDAQNQVANQAQQSGEDIDQGQTLVKMFQDGTAKVNLKLGDNAQHNQKNMVTNIATVLAIAGFPYLAYKFGSKFMAKKYREQFKQLHRDYLDANNKYNKGRQSFRKRLDAINKQYRKAVKRKRKKQIKKLQAQRRALLKKYKEWLKNEKTIKERNKLRKQQKEALKKSRKYRNKSKFMKGYKGNLLVMGLWEMLSGDSNKSWLARGAGVATEAGIFTIAEKGLGWKGQLLSMILAPTVGGFVSDLIDSKTAHAQQSDSSSNGLASQQQAKQYKNLCDTQTQMTNSYQKKPEMKKQTGTIEDVAQALGLSNEQFQNMIKESCEKHGIDMDKIGATEKQMWANSFSNFMEIYQDVGVALNKAAQALAMGNNAIRNAGSYNVNFSSNAVAEWQSADPEGFKIAEEMAKKYNVPIGLVAAIARQESGFNQNARSGAGATGVMQLMPETAKGLGVNPNNKAENIEGGVKLLRENLDYYKGDTVKAVAAYNAGAGNVDDWVAQYGSNWYNHIPFEETKNYIAKVGVVSGASGGYTPTVGAPTYNSMPSTTLSPLVHTSVSIAGAQSNTIAMVNYAAQVYQQMFGRDDFWLSALTNGHGADTPHGQGLKADVGGSALEESYDNRIKFQNALQAAGIGANNEYDEESSGSTGGHFDLDVRGYNWQQQKNYGGFNGGANSSPVFDMSKITGASKPLSIKDAYDAGQKALQNALAPISSGKKIQGAIINGMYVDPKQKFESIDDIKTKLRKQRDEDNARERDQIKRATASTDGDVKATDDYLAQQVKQILGHEEKEAILEKRRKQGRRIQQLIEAVKELALEFYDEDVMISCDI